MYSRLNKLVGFAFCTSITFIQGTKPQLRDKATVPGVPFKGSSTILRMHIQYVYLLSAGNIGRSM